MDYNGTIFTEKNIYEFYTEPSLRVPHKYIVWYLKSGQPLMNVLDGLFSKSQIEDMDYIADKITEQEEN